MNNSVKYIHLLFLLLIGMFFFVSCDKDDTNLMESKLELQSPYGSWELKGYTSTEKKQLEKLSSNSVSFELTLNDDGTFQGKTSVNEIGGKFKIDTTRRTISFQRNDFYTTKVNETSDGVLYLERFFKVNNYRVFTDRLELYYSKTDFILFTKLVKNK